MSDLSRRSLLTGGISLLALPKAEREQQYRFATAEYEIRMTLECYDREPNRGLRFEERSTDRRFCLSARGDENQDCVDDFEGSIAVMRYRISSRTGSGASPAMREYVRTIDGKDRLPLRPPFERAIQVEGGRASDIQVFGYRSGNPGSVAANSGQAPEKDDAWYLLRQNLYLKNSPSPFLILHWKHELSSIRVLDIIPEDGTWRMTHGA